MSIVFIVSSAIIAALLFFRKQKNNSHFSFLPHQTKLVGVLILIGGSVVSSLPNNTSILIDIKNFSIILGLLFICLSKDRKETEQLQSLRLYLLSISAFVTFVIYQMFIIFDFFKIKESSVAFLPICVLASYLFVYYLGKRYFINK
jgi:hypothetical protein